MWPCSSQLVLLVLWRLYQYILIQIQSSCPTQYFTGQILRKQNYTGSWELCIFSHINHHNTKTKQNPEYNQTIGFLEKVGAVGGRRSNMCDIIYEHIMTNSASLIQTLHMATQIDIQKYSHRKFERAWKHIFEIHLICILSDSYI